MRQILLKIFLCVLFCPLSYSHADDFESLDSTIHAYGSYSFHGDPSFVAIAYYAYSCAAEFDTENATRLEQSLNKVSAMTQLQIKLLALKEISPPARLETVRAFLYQKNLALKEFFAQHLEQLNSKDVMECFDDRMEALVPLR